MVAMNVVLHDFSESELLNIWILINVSTWDGDEVILPMISNSAYTKLARYSDFMILVANVASQKRECWRILAGYVAWSMNAIMHGIQVMVEQFMQINGVSSRLLHTVQAPLIKGRC